MTDTQFYFAIGLPMFSILVVWLGSTIVNTRAINALAQRIDDQGKSLTQRIDDLRSEMKAGFDAVNGRLDRLETRLTRIEDEVHRDHESRISRLEARVFSSAA